MGGAGCAYAATKPFAANFACALSLAMARRFADAETFEGASSRHI